MAEITVELIKKLRDKTNAGMMDCKGALKEADGDLEAAETVLRKKGIAAADKKASRTAKEGVIASRIDPENRSGVLVEVNCETDFVAKNDNFRSFVEEVLTHVGTADSVDSPDALLAQPWQGGSDQTVADVVKAKIGELGENMVIPRFQRFEVDGEGVVASYIHLQGKVGVLIEVGCESGEGAKDEGFRNFVKDITLHIAAAQPICIHRDEVSADEVAKEREIYAEQVKGKPENIIDKIVDGKLEKFYSNVCLLEQGFIKDPDKTVGELADEMKKALGEEISIRHFVRYGVGETAE